MQRGKKLFIVSIRARISDNNSDDDDDVMANEQAEIHSTCIFVGL